MQTPTAFCSGAEIFMDTCTPSYPKQYVHHNYSVISHSQSRQVHLGPACFRCRFPIYSLRHIRLAKWDPIRYNKQNRLYPSLTLIGINFVLLAVSCLGGPV